MPRDNLRVLKIKRGDRLCNFINKKLLSFGQLALVCFGFFISNYSYAAVQRSFINGDFELPTPGTVACYAFVDADNIPGWETTHSALPSSVQNGCSYTGLAISSGRIMEIWGNSFQSEQPRSGVQIAELNAFESSTIYQKICINNSEDVAWSFAHKARSSAGVNRMAFVLGPTIASIAASSLTTTYSTGGIVQVESSHNGIGSVLACQSGTSVGSNLSCTTNTFTSPNGTKWMEYAGNFKWNGTGGDMYVAFGSLLGDPGAPGSGNHLDSVKLTLKPYIEFSSASGVSSNSESVTNPTNFGLRVTGEFLTPLMVNVTVTGGTATYGVDYTTPNGSTTFGVMVPAGNYDGTTIIPIGITIVNDTEIEPSESIILSVSTSSEYQVASTVTCGATPVSNSTLTILDDDAAKFSINKRAKFVSGGPFNFGFTATNGGPSSTTNIAVTTSNLLATTAALTSVPVTANNTSIVISETQPSSNWVMSALSCIDTNAAISGNAVNTNLATFNASTSVITIPASAVKTKANIVCEVTNDNIDAVNEIVSKQPNLSLTTDVSSNDSKATGSVYTQQSTTCSPAGSMTSAGVASYTSPAANSSCTVTYQVCAPSPNNAICDTAVLTINTGNEPSYTVTKTVSQTPLVVGKTGQSYAINIAIADGPTTADLLITDALPAGMETSGVITATGGTLTGCPAAGASNLTGCKINSGAATGTVIITVPVTVGSSSVNPSSNTASVTGGGSTRCPGHASCSSQISTPIIDAVNESVIQQPNITTSADVSSNDKFPVGSSYTQTSTTCSGTVSLTTSGVASYTTPTANNSCSITYQVCAPSPNASVCDTAILTINTGNDPSFVVSKTVSHTPLVVGKTGQFYTITIAVTDGPTLADILISDTLPTGMVTSGTITATGGTLSGCPASGATNLTGCKIAIGAASGNVVVTVPVTVSASAASPSVNSASISGGGGSQCPGAAACTGQVSSPILDAIDEAVTKQPNISSSTDVSSNDVYPAGSSYSQQSTTCSPAGSMSSAGVASYTSPAANSSCTVSYEVCAPSPNQANCDTAVLTINTGNEPSYTISKTVSQTPLVVGQSGQFYTLTMVLTDGPSTANLTINDTLPSGITTSGAVTALGGVLSGCPAAGASSLSGCVINSGAVTGTIVITVPVTVGASAVNPSSNTASLSGGGTSKCPADASCSSSVTTPVIDAVNESVTKQPSISTSTDVSGNDKYPVGSSYSQTATTCSPAGSMSSAGLASYTSPAANSSCTVTYQVCAPSPNEAICDSAVLTVNTGNEPSFKMTKTASQTPLVVGKAGQFYTLDIEVIDGPTTAEISVADTLPTGMTTSAAITATGGTLSNCPAAGATSISACKIAAGAATGHVIITVPVTVASNTTNPSTNSATVSGGGSTKCPLDATCTSEVTTPVIDAVSESVNKQPNLSTSTDVSGNDKFPVGSSYSQTATTCSPAGSMSTAGVASYTSPAANSSCTVTYQVCAPSPNTTVCDTAVLTINTGNEPSFNVTKTASQTPLVVGQSNQYYTISIEVVNGPTTAAITFNDSFPTGVVSRDVISASAGTLTACPGVGATSLAGCSLASGLPTGTITLTVPVNVGATAVNPSKNTVTLSGGGSTKCPLDASCTAEVTSPVLDAVNDSVSKQPNISTSTDVSSNDKYPAGSSFTQKSTTCSPAGTMTSAGVASYTSPAPNSSCTVSYEVCAPSPNQTICDSAVLTITTGNEPSYSVVKTVSQSPLVVGKTGQFYTLTISIVDGPTTANIIINDTLPTGMVTSGVISATGGSLTGCPAAGASSLSTCQVLAGAATGNVVITVPVSVDASAVNPSKNSVTLSGGGSTKCPLDASCKAEVTSPVIDAVDEAVSKQPNVAASTDVSGNDKYPVGSSYSQKSTTCSPAGSMTSAGVASYQSPGASQSCTVTYEVCAPAPNNSICDTAVLTITAGLEPTFIVSKTASQTPMVVGKAGQYYTVSINIQNGPTTADIVISDTLPTGITTSAAISASGGVLTGCPAAGASALTGCKVQAGAANGNVVITVPVTVSSAAVSPSKNSVQITGGGSTKCPADANCNAEVSTPILEAVNESVSKQPQISSNTDVSGNDKYPVGSSYSQTASTCSPIGSMTNAGVASYTTPAANSSCTVSYQVCAPAPNTGVCASAVLTITTGDAPHLVVLKTASHSPMVSGVSGQNYTIKITVSNGPTTAPITLKDNLPMGMVTSEAISASGGILSACPAAGASNINDCSLAAGIANGDVLITVPVTVGTLVSSPAKNIVTVTGGGDPTCTGVAPNCTSETSSSIAIQKIDVVKSVGKPVQISEKVFEVQYAIVVANIDAGNPTVFNVQVNDYLKKTFPNAETISVRDYSVASYKGSAICLPAANFTGVNANTKLLLGNTNLASGQACLIKFKVKIDFGKNTVPASAQFNMAYASGTAEKTVANNGFTFTSNFEPIVPTGVITTDMSVNTIASNQSVEAPMPQLPTKSGLDTEEGEATVTLFISDSSKALIVEKKSFKAEGAIGDKVTYQLLIKNPNQVAINALITDTPPVGFDYVQGSAQFKGQSIPANFANGQLNFELGEIAAQAEVLLEYELLINDSVVAGKATNCASAKATNGSNQSQESCATVVIKTGLFLEKLANVASSEIGDSVQYSLKVKSVGGVTENVFISDALPLGFKLIPGSVQVLRAGVLSVLVDPIGAPGPQLTFKVGIVKNLEVVEVRYRVRVDFGADQGDGINSAQAKAPYATSSAVKKVKVKVSGGVFTKEACIVGMVFADCNKNALKDKDELSIPGVRVYLQDGSHFTTDLNGQYSYCGLKPTTYVVKPDPSTLPQGSVLGITSNANLGSAASLLLHIKNGELARADFAEVSCTAGVMEQIKNRKNGVLIPSSTPTTKPVVFSSKNNGSCSESGKIVACNAQGVGK